MFLYFAMMDTLEAREKFEILYRKYRNLMYYVAYQIVGNREDAEDAVQQAFFSIIKIIDKIHGSECPETKSLVVLITERKAIDILRTSHRNQLLPLNEEVLVCPFHSPVITAFLMHWQHCRHITGKFCC